MQLLIRQRVFSWSDSYDVYDGGGNPKYRVRAAILALGHQIHITDLRTGEEVAGVHQKLIALLPQYELIIHGRSMGSVRKELSLFRPRYHMQKLGWSVRGDVLGWHYDVSGPNGPVMHITKELLRWGDTYVLNIQNPENELLCLMVAIAIDAANCDHNH